MELNKGTRFLHSRVLDNRDMKSPQLYEITRIARGVVYYKAVDYETNQPEGCSQCCTIEDFPKWCKNIVTEK